MYIFIIYLFVCLFTFLFLFKKIVKNKLKIPTPRLQFPDNTRNKPDLSQYLCICHFIWGKNRKKYRLSFTRVDELWDRQLMLFGLSKELNKEEKKRKQTQTNNRYIISLVVSSVFHENWQQRFINTSFAITNIFTNSWSVNLSLTL